MFYRGNKPGFVENISETTDYTYSLPKKNICKRIFFTVELTNRINLKNSWLAVI